MRTPAATVSASRSAVSRSADRRTWVRSAASAGSPSGAGSGARDLPASPGGALGWQQRRLPQREGHPGPGRGVLGDRRHRQPGQPPGRRCRISGGGGGQHERRARAPPVAGALAAQPAQHVGDVRPEHAPVDVALVDHHVGQPAQEPGPLRVAGEDAVVQHVGVGQHEPGVPPDPLPFGAGGVPVVAGRTYALDLQRGDGAQLVGGERLGRCQVEHGGAGVGEQGGQRGQLVRQGLAGRGAGGHHDVLPVVRQAGRLGLVPPRRRHPPPGVRGAQFLRNPPRPRHRHTGPGRHPFDVGDRVGGVPLPQPPQQDVRRDGRSRDRYGARWPLGVTAGGYAGCRGHVLHSRTGVRKSEIGGPGRVGTRPGESSAGLPGSG